MAQKAGADSGRSVEPLMVSQPAGCASAPAGSLPMSPAVDFTACGSQRAAVGRLIEGYLATRQCRFGSPAICRLCDSHFRASHSRESGRESRCSALSRSGDFRLRESRLRGSQAGGGVGSAPRSAGAPPGLNVAALRLQSRWSDARNIPWLCLRPPVNQLTGDHRQGRAQTSRLSTGHEGVHRNAGPPS
jgi:hypothetical protein